MYPTPNTNLLTLTLLLTTSLASPLIEKRAPPISMGLARTFGALAASTLTSVGNTVVTGDCGTYPGTSITGFPPGPGVCTGITTSGGTASMNAEASCLLAYNNAKGLVPTRALTSANLGGLVLPPGIYTFPTQAAALSAGSTLTLSGAGNPNGQWVFQIGTTFAAGANSRIVMSNGGQACNVYFVLGTAASIGANASLQGNILAGMTIAASAGASGSGTWCSKNAAVTLINNKLAALSTCTSV
ncbi:hypothetical protein HYALB_00013315 [Hymenoscyphus albidus]|uniref:Antifreeze protein n=1 Tax=Hymenoscyphus albidus TaxID=595503 RepID=A0A9N9Q9A3_9HELO|nr:hypothetical protein HYALB_00013315 [Hymenoscyphus albidus]